MPPVVAVAYVKHGRLHYADPAGVDVSIGQQVVVGHQDMDRVGTVLWGPSEPLDDIAGLPQVRRPATEQDVAEDDDARRRAAKAKVAAKRLVRSRGLPMQVLGSEWVARDRRVTIWFAAPHRVDFRDLLRVLTSQLGMRVLLRQVNERERARVVGGIGVCGRDLCCATFLDGFEPVTLQMARDQHLGVDPLRIAGACGRLMCCLRYEHPAYVHFTGHPPGDGGGCSSADSCGPRVAHDQAHG